MVEQLKYLFESEKSYFSQQDIRDADDYVVPQYKSPFSFASGSRPIEKTKPGNGTRLKDYLEKYVTVSSKFYHPLVR